MPGGSFGSSGFLDVDGAAYRIFRLDAIDGAARLPFSLKILLENLLRNEDGRMVTAGQIQALAGWDPAAEPSEEIGFTPARVLMQDFTGVPCIVNLAAMREAMTALGGAPARISPLRPAELIIDHSVIADHFGQPGSLERNIELEYQRNRERYQFLRWGQGTFRGLRVVPPGTGICHQVNIEHLARVVFAENGTAFPDTLVGTDSHTPMVNGLGVLGWGVGGIEAEAAMLGQPVSMLIPRVVGVRLSGELPDGSTATDLVLTITEALRATGVVGTFVEFYGPGVAAVPVANRATIGNMSPEYGSTCAIFPIDTAPCPTCGSPAAPPARSRWSRPTPRNRDCGTSQATSLPTPRRSSSTSRGLSRRSPARNGRRTAFRWRRHRRRSGPRCRATPAAVPSRSGWTQAAPSPSRPPTRSR